MSHRHTYAFVMLIALGGCSQHLFPTFHGSHGSASANATYPTENPIFVPVSDHEFVWHQVVDTIDDYFQISLEERVRIVGGVITEGRIETVPLSGATILEPWRKDSTRGYEKLHATLQSIRRRASVRVMPVAAGYSIEVAVYKELEDVDRPEHSTVGDSTLRYEGTVVRDKQDQEQTSITLGWIAIGRDTTLEQEMLANLQSRLAVSSPLNTSSSIGLPTQITLPQIQ
ncbi:MAG: hypothetical protein H6822_00900 [Planctomycetaceae bacterium]|nr:hypothetical protein [Planctomycetales bacterium]MCB9920703.1 hypothetical protein [Planctomycetaceae bacterium]